jgi:hypothetical protein
MVAWPPTGYSPSQSLNSVFTISGPLAKSTFLEALWFGGGTDLAGAQRILMRAAVAGLLNSAHPDIAYPKSSQQVIDLVNAAIASNNRDAILAAAGTLDTLNNLGCTIDAHGNVILPPTGSGSPTPPTDSDFDRDGCTKVEESGADPSAGGQRDDEYFWDFYDVPAGPDLHRDGAVSAFDIFAIIGRFASTDEGAGEFDRYSDPLSTPNELDLDDPRASYHPAFDRGVMMGDSYWDVAPPNGAVSGTDIFSSISQYSHECQGLEFAANNGGTDLGEAGMILGSAFWTSLLGMTWVQFRRNRNDLGRDT